MMSDERTPRREWEVGGQQILAMSTNTTTTDITATTATTKTSRALTRAIEANEAAEKAIVQELKNLASQKAENRKKAAQLTHALLLLSSSLPITADNSSRLQLKPPLDKKSLENIYRPWNRVFFLDGKNSVPEPNPDTVRRRAVANDNDGHAFFYHTNPPWLAKESKVMLDLGQQQHQQQQQPKPKSRQEKEKAVTTTATAAMMMIIDFETVARELHQRAHQARGRNASFPSATAKPRSALECEIEYNRQKMHEQQKNKKKVLSSNIISKTISSLTTTPTPSAAAATTTTTTTTTTDTGSTRQAIDWQAVAKWLQEHEHIQTSAWECFAEHQKARRRQNNDGGTTATSSSSVEPWTPKQDEVLLKYVAAMGPQALVDGHAMNHLLTRLLPNKSKSQILNRINHSLLNPSLLHDSWSGDEERLLTVCMKMYYATTDNTGAAAEKKNRNDKNNIEKQALYLAGTHLPHRATASILHKWHRTLNPDYDSGPFTKAEDAKLLQVLRAAPTTTTTTTQQQQQQQPLGWKALAQRHFPNRHAHRLINRWSEIASNQDIIARFGKDYFQKNHHHHHHDDKNNDNSNNKRSSSSSSSRPLDAQDLVVPIKKKKKS